MVITNLTVLARRVGKRMALVIAGVGEHLDLGGQSSVFDRDMAINKTDN
jgi:hypothetical protein